MRRTLTGDNQAGKARMPGRHDEGRPHPPVKHVCGCPEGRRGAAPWPHGNCTTRRSGWLGRSWRSRSSTSPVWAASTLLRARWLDAGRDAEGAAGGFSPGKIRCTAQACAEAIAEMLSVADGRPHGRRGSRQ